MSLYHEWAAIRNSKIEKEQQMNQDIFNKVQDFRKKLKLPMSSKAKLLEPVDISFYARFLMEELSELMKAHEKEDLVGAADALADLAYVTMGCAHHMGIDLIKILNIVHECNMKKEPGTTSRGHKQDAIKPKGWVGPEDLIALELLNQCR
jgi:predicted HAD superfamily Cof-like phosphohydrolase